MLIRPLAVWIALASMSAAAAAQAVRPFETERAAAPANAVDTSVLASLRKRGIAPARPCSDQVFVRRAFVDVIGTLPRPQEVMAFLADRRSGKRAALIDTLLARTEFADYWSLKWCDILRVKAEFPINLWPNAVQAYHRWIRNAIAENTPYDRFARELLTSSGSNFRTPPVNFYRAVQGHEPAAFASAVALTFMGTRLQGWPAARRAGLESLFSRVAFKPTAEWKEEIVFLDPAASGPLKAVLPDGRPVVVRAGADPRKAFADWLIAPDNEWFGRNIVNRIWSWLMGRGIIHAPDDIRPDNPAVNPKLLALLERELVRSGYDLRHLYRLILNSRTYQQSSIPRSTDASAEALFACYPVRRLEAEVLADALCWLTSSTLSYTSPIPEPFTHIPGTLRTITLADGSITSPFLEMFGRPDRDTGLESERSSAATDAQRLYLLNSTFIRTRIERSQLVRRLGRMAGRSPRRLVAGLYVTILSRPPTDAERRIAETYLASRGRDRRGALVDLAWALINTKEFQYRH